MHPKWWCEVSEIFCNFIIFIIYQRFSLLFELHHFSLFRNHLIYFDNNNPDDNNFKFSLNGNALIWIQFSICVETLLSIKRNEQTMKFSFLRFNSFIFEFIIIIERWYEVRRFIGRNSLIKLMLMALKLNFSSSSCVGLLHHIYAIRTMHPFKMTIFSSSNELN